eukprot:281995-Chlamydomonas_euryale.AAC.1
MHPSARAPDCACCTKTCPLLYLAPLCLPRPPAAGQPGCAHTCIQALGARSRRLYQHLLLVRPIAQAVPTPVARA